MYKYIVTSNKVIAISTYGNESVRGIAKCSPTDTFDMETGKRLATARCNKKIAKKRYCGAMKNVQQAKLAYKRAAEYLEQAMNYETKALLDYTSAINAVVKVERDLRSAEQE